MPEGPSILMLAEEVQAFAGKVVRSATGRSRIDMSRLEGRKLLEVRSWGKHLLLRFSGFSVRVHLLLFGSYRINDRRDRLPTLSLGFTKGELNFYAGAVKLIEGELDEVYDWSTDVLSDLWDAAAARRKLAQAPDTLACDALLDQAVFAGVGNIIKNEALFRLRLHPLSRLGAMPARLRAKLVDEARRYSFDFLAWRRVGALKRNLQVHGRKSCPRCNAPLHLEVLGKAQRRAFWCEHCQVHHDLAGTPKAKAAKRTPSNKKRAER